MAKHSSQAAVMRILVVLALVAIALGAPLEEEQRINGENGWYVPQLDGSFEWISVEEADQLMASLPDDRASTIVEFYLYTRSNPTVKQQISASDDIIKASNFNGAHPTRFIAHGWTDSHKGHLNIVIRDAWLAKGEYNVISVDWSSRSQTINYLSSVRYVPDVGKLVAEFADYLHMSHGMSFSTLTVIGQSLGAHVAGFTAKNTMRQVDTVVGLDPAMPLYSYDSPAKRLASTDGYYVETIQTNGGELGFLHPIGKASFYPNGGKKQPGCGIDIGGGCSHAVSDTYYAEAVEKNNFPSMRCENYLDAVNMDCGATYSSVRMGASTNTYMASGDYYVPVNSKSPYGMLG